MDAVRNTIWATGRKPSVMRPVWLLRVPEMGQISLLAMKGGQKGACTSGTCVRSPTEQIDRM